VYHRLAVSHCGRIQQDRGDCAVKTYQCVICGFIYDEAKGVPDEGIPPGTRWDDVPADWTCPECGAGKDDFEMVEI
jgi:rubredoxin